MKKRALTKNLQRAILKSFGRYVALILIIALGAGLFIGLMMTKSDIVATGQEFMNSQNMYDLSLLTLYGWSKEHVDTIAQQEGIVDAEGVVYTEFIVQAGDENTESVYRFYEMPETINMPYLRAGRMPENENECLADFFGPAGKFLGQKIVIQESNGKSRLDTIRVKEFTIVGCVSSPLHIAMNRGTTTIGNGIISSFVYVQPGVLDLDYIPEIHITLEGESEIYTDSYKEAIKNATKALEPSLQSLADARVDELRQQAADSLLEGEQQIIDAWDEFHEKRAEANEEIYEAKEQLWEAEEEIAANEQLIADGEVEIKNATTKLQNAQYQLNQGRNELNTSIATVDQRVAEAEAEIYSRQTSLNSELASVNSSLSSVNSELSSVNSQIENETDETTLAQLKAQKAELESEQAELQSRRSEINEELSMVEQAIDAIPSIKETIQQEIAKKEAELQSAANQISSGKAELEKKKKELADGKAQLEEAMIELEEGWAELKKTEADVSNEFLEALSELKDAEEELEDAKKRIDAIEGNRSTILNRNSNPGYANLESCTKILEGITRVFPIFFLLIASLVCITTMTRMIDEERTEIGTLKALGYKNNEIIRKYLYYSGSSAVIGCILGVIAGNTVFPIILWDSYKATLCMQPNIVLTVNWKLCFAVAIVYLAVLLLVTWNCCRKTLQNVSAELIRPKAPDAGKALLVEKLPFWNKLSFLNKVMIRNIFRYRQRLAMMLVGIGGCTAALLTGYGIQDSIVNVVDIQFSEVTVYDMSVYFQDPQTPESKAEFMKETKGLAEKVAFAHQSTVNLLLGDTIREIYMISSNDDLSDFINMHAGNTPVESPGLNEMILSLGTAQELDINIGDKVLLRNTDLEEMELTVSGIYDNHVYNYTIVAPETIEQYWGAAPEEQMALVIVPEDVAVHNACAEIKDMIGVMDVSVSEDLADLVGSILESIESVVLVIVTCALLLAISVLYNLTNINISERIREIATIKVLGFNSRETGAYIFKENMALTIMGCLLGMLFGPVLLNFVMDQIKVDYVCFKTILLNSSYMWAIVLTILSAIAVDFIFYFKLQKINMAEALKSVE